MVVASFRSPYRSTQLYCKSPVLYFKKQDLNVRLSARQERRRCSRWGLFSSYWPCCALRSPACVCARTTATRASCATASCFPARTLTRSESWTRRTTARSRPRSRGRGGLYPDPATSFWATPCSGARCTATVRGVTGAAGWLCPWTCPPTWWTRSSTSPEPKTCAPKLRTTRASWRRSARGGEPPARSLCFIIVIFFFKLCVLSNIIFIAWSISNNLRVQ